MSLQQAWSSWFTRIFKAKKPIEVIQPKLKPYRKPSDTTKLTRQMYDFTLEMKVLQKNNNEFYGIGGDHHYETTEELCDYLNIVFGTNFSRCKLSRIWQGKVNREDLPQGIPYNIPF
jgi:hypothetical protein